MVTMVSSQSRHNFAPSRAPARGRAGVRARVWLPTDHVDHVLPFQPFAFQKFTNCMVKSETFCAMFKLPANRESRPQLKLEQENFRCRKFFLSNRKFFSPIFLRRNLLKQSPPCAVKDLRTLCERNLKQFKVVTLSWAFWPGWPARPSFSYLGPKSSPLNCPARLQPLAAHQKFCQATTLPDPLAKPNPVTITNQPHGRIDFKNIIRLKKRRAPRGRICFAG